MIFCKADHRWHKRGYVVQLNTTLHLVGIGSEKIRMGISNEDYGRFGIYLSLEAAKELGNDLISLPSKIADFPKRE